MKKGFTLLEILLVIAAIGILAAIVIIAINPNRQLAQVRDAQRSSDSRSLLQALEQYLIDNNQYPPEVLSQSVNTIVEVCTQNASDCTGYLDLESALVPMYIASIPNDPSLSGNGSGYAVSKTSSGLGIVAIGTEGVSTLVVGQEFTPDLLNGLVSWYDFSDPDTVTLDTTSGIDTASTIISKHNSSNTLSQPTKFNQPRFITSPRSNGTAISFEGNGQFLTSSLNTSDYFGIGGSDDGAIVVAFDPDESPLQNQYLFQFQRNTASSFLSFTTQSWLNGPTVTPDAQDAGIFFRDGSDWQSYRLQDALTPEEAFVITATFDDSVPLIKAFFDDTEIYTSANTTNYDGDSGNYPLIIGNSGNIDSQYYGDIYEMLVFDRALTDEEVQTLVTYLTYRHNL
jgi:prepilin-type N-terminal cleavage/methylation domain-containing protein